VPFVDETAADRTRAGVQIFVRAPDGEIDVPFVQRQWQIADGVRHVEAGDGADAMRGAGDARAVECLAGAVLHAGPQHEREFIAATVDRGFDVFDAQGLFARARSQLYQGAVGIELVPGKLPEDGVPIRGERAGFDEHFVAHADGPVERRHHEMQVHGERVHGDDFVRERAGDVLQTLGEILRVVDPRARRGVVTRYAEPRPVGQLFADVVERGSRREPE
jgi:hypothetical protein